MRTPLSKLWWPAHRHQQFRAPPKWTNISADAFEVFRLVQKFDMVRVLSLQYTHGLISPMEEAEQDKWTTQACNDIFERVAKRWTSAADATLAGRDCPIVSMTWATCSQVGTCGQCNLARHWARVVSACCYAFEGSRR